ncbi:imidazolonepropionase-like amidohydrolase [Povalibacter uvarum]|uniref:Imidazolonepropionase-like amidohydrolase n=1 Tax=Povalibacter uvarum TaxID=732238 RepID=A0A841HN85_9GAMM|nr:amidohydrolase family protein [Povalibacter uvarum]MBB6093628.1 imidazolonepropionase-like amidohydrolase [Povalibacter uvarum]
MHRILCRPFAVALAALFLTCNIASAQETTKYTVVIAGNNAGFQTTTTAADGTRKYAYEFNDRGRGPKLTSTIRLDAAGLPVSIETAGNDYLKAPVSEKFSVANAVARWDNGAEKEERKLPAPAFYVSLQSMPEELALLANALRRAEGNSLALLPAGRASVRKTGETTVKVGDRSRHVVAYEIDGLGFSPYSLWLEDDGKFFAAVSSWLSVIQEGWESSASALLKLQDEVDARRTRDLAHKLTRKPGRPVAITHANLFDSVSGKSTPNTTILIEGNRILSVGADAQIKPPKNAEIIDAAGKAVIPGLWDMHVHIGPNEGMQHLAAGVTSVRDLANDNDALQAIRRGIDAGDEIGPRIMMVGIIDGRGPFAGPTKMLIETQAEAKAAVDSYAKWGYEGIKVYSSVKPELVPGLIREAHAKGLRVNGHVPAHMTARQFVEAGADELQHINFVFLNFFDDVKDTRTPARFTTIAERAATLDLDSAPVRDFIKLLKEHHTVVDPTVSIFEGMLTDRPGKIAAGYATIADRLPPQVRRGLITGGLPVPEGQDQRFKDSAAALLHMVKRLYDAGIPIVAGTDAMPGFTLHRELELYVKAGIPAPDALRIATLGSAKVMKRDSQLGSVAPGKLADLLIIDGDPARNISDVRNTSLVIKDGNLYDPKALYGQMGVAP